MVIPTRMDSRTSSSSSLPTALKSFSAFSKDFNLKMTSTEQSDPLTKNLSQTLHKNLVEGLELLLEADRKVLEGLQKFIPTIDNLAPQIGEKIGRGGRIFLVGSGSSGRIGIDLAAKCMEAFPQLKETVFGVIAGGDAALVRAKEGFEDSEADGRKALEAYNLNPLDTVILLSASGSAFFNVGCGHFAAEQNAQIFYFYNSESIPDRTQHLFDRLQNPVIPLKFDIGPQAIAGSTRLQAATFAEAAVGALLAGSLYCAVGKKEEAKEYPRTLLTKIGDGMDMLRTQLKQVGKFAQAEAEIFADPRSNFRRLRDETNWGYVTIIADKKSIRGAFIDTAETSPTYSTNPPQRTSESQKKRAEFQAYLAGEKDNRNAWEALLGRKIRETDVQDAEEFLFACEVEGPTSYKERPKGKGNFLFGISILEDGKKPPQEIVQELRLVNQAGGKTGLILLCRGNFDEELRKHLNDTEESLLIVEDIATDPLGIAETILLKQILNAISNGSMILMNKVHGNQMIDVRASNNKLIDRCIRLIQEIWHEYQPSVEFQTKDLYEYVIKVNDIKKKYETEKGLYAPSVVKIVLGMLALKAIPTDINFEHIVERLVKENESIAWIGNIKF